MLSESGGLYVPPAHTAVPLHHQQPSAQFSGARLDPAVPPRPHGPDTVYEAFIRQRTGTGAPSATSNRNAPYSTAAAAAGAGAGRASQSGDTRQGHVTTHADGHMSPIFSSDRSAVEAARWTVTMHDRELDRYRRWLEREQARQQRVPPASASAAASSSMSAAGGSSSSSYQLSGPAEHSPRLSSSSTTVLRPGSTAPVTVPLEQAQAQDSLSPLGSRPPAAAAAVNTARPAVNGVNQPVAVDHVATVYPNIIPHATLGAVPTVVVPHGQYYMAVRPAMGTSAKDAVEQLSPLRGGGGGAYRDHRPYRPGYSDHAVDSPLVIAQRNKAADHTRFNDPQYSPLQRLAASTAGPAGRAASSATAAASGTVTNTGGKDSSLTVNVSASSSGAGSVLLSPLAIAAVAAAEAKQKSRW